MLVKSIHHVAILVSDVEKSKKFYEGAMGLEPRKRLTETVSKNRGAWYTLGDLELHLQERQGHKPKTEQHVAFLTSDLDALVKQVEQHGGRSEDAKLIEGFRKRRFVYDIDENRIELLER